MSTKKSCETDCCKKGTDVFITVLSLALMGVALLAMYQSIKFTQFKSQFETKTRVILVPQTQTKLVPVWNN